MLVPIDPRDPGYLLTGTPVQRQAHLVLGELGIWTVLAPHTPVLAGTVPLELDVPGSDLDVICHAGDLPAFQRLVESCYMGLPGFRAGIRDKEDGPAVVAAFAAGSFAVEVFGQALPVERQRAYRHLVVEARVLHLGGAHALNELRRLRAEGLKTEPAFARFLSLPGDPYLALLDLEAMDDDALAALVLGRQGK